LQAAGCAMALCHPIKNVIKKRNILFDEEAAKAIILNNCWNKFLVRNLLPGKILLDLAANQLKWQHCWPQSYAYCYAY